MPTVHFENGDTLIVIQEIVDVIAKNINKPTGAANWQCFTHSQENETFLMINLLKVNYIE